MTDEQKLLSDLAEVSADLVEWAQDKIDDGTTAADIKELLREAARLTGRA